MDQKGQKYYENVTKIDHKIDIKRDKNRLRNWHKMDQVHKFIFKSLLESPLHFQNNKVWLKSGFVVMSHTPKIVDNGAKNLGITDANW